MRQRTVREGALETRLSFRSCATSRTITGFFKTLTATAQQLTPIERWCRVLSQALVKYLRDRQLEPPVLLPAPG